MINVVHVLPYDGIGGVETAARSMRGMEAADISFHSLYISRRNASDTARGTYCGPFASENNPINYLWAIGEIFKLRPEIVILSLWRSCLLGLAIKAISPRTRVVLFLHRSSPAHLVDALLHRLMMKWACEIWADSNSTLAMRLGQDGRRSRVISFLVSRIPFQEQLELAPNFIFWGRLHRDKGLERALSLFSTVLRAVPRAKFTIVGPDAGMGASLRAVCDASDLKNAVRFAGPLGFAEITEEAMHHAFYLQTSHVEGMAISVVEAMQLGLLPVVTPVGEIANYCSGANSVIINDLSQAADEVQRVLGAPERFHEMRRAGADVWRERPLYRDDVIAACRGIVDRAKQC